MKSRDVVGNDKTGRLIRLNRRTLEPGHKGYASVVFWGDVHYGYPTCEIERALEMLKWCVKNRVYILGMGDFIESGLRTSVGASNYEQLLNPQKQLDFMIEALQPAAKAGLLLGLHSGNHEDRISDATSINVVKMMCKALDVPFLGSACWTLLRVGSQNYTIYSLHGASGSRFKHTKLKSVIDIGMWFEADIIAQGHVHEKAVTVIVRQRVNARNRTVEDRKVHCFLTGHYLGYDGSYAQMKGMPPAGLGSPKVQLYADRWDLHGSV